MRRRIFRAWASLAVLAVTWVGSATSSVVASAEAADAPGSCSHSDMDPLDESTWAKRPPERKGELSASSPTHKARLQLSQDGVPIEGSSCDKPQTVPPVLEPTTDFAYAAHKVKNWGSAPSCVHVMVFTASVPSGTNGIVGSNYVTAHLGDFDPLDVGKNYLADPGSEAGFFALPRYMSFVVPAGAEFTVVVHSGVSRERMLEDAACNGCDPDGTRRPGDLVAYDIWVAGCGTPASPPPGNGNPDASAGSTPDAGGGAGPGVDASGPPAGGPPANEPSPGDAVAEPSSGEGGCSTARANTGFGLVGLLWAAAAIALRPRRRASNSGPSAR